MNESANKYWIDYVNAKDELQKSTYLLVNLNIEAQTNILKEAMKDGEENYVIDYLLTVEPINFPSKTKKLTINLLDIILDVALFPGDNEIRAMNILVDLSKFNKEYVNIISEKCKIILLDYEKEGDYEVVQRVGNLLYDINSELFPFFISVCKNSTHKDVKDILELWDDYEEL